MIMTKDEPTKLDGHDVSHLLQIAGKVVYRKTADSLVLDQAAEDRTPKFVLEELTIGKVLGRGGFCVVREITQITTKDEHVHTEEPEEDDEAIIHNITQGREFMAKHYLRHGKDYRYAIKVIKEEAKQSAQLYVNAVVDLAIEARFLAVIRHPNIIKMRAMAASSPCDGSFFLVLDKLSDTLSVRLKAWEKRLKKGIFQKLSCGAKKDHEFWGERLMVGFDLSCAFVRLHEMKIMYRDIKPDNIGFDVRGDVKVFDFGLAKEFKEKDRSTDGTFKLTVETGSPRYMAPEVFLRKPYNETCDVYSFCILLWQILKVAVPYDDLTTTTILTKVCKNGVRPPMDMMWSVAVSECLRSGWTESIAKRASMANVSAKLRAIIMQETKAEVEDFHGCSGKSELSA